MNKSIKKYLLIGIPVLIIGFLAIIFLKMSCVDDFVFHAKRIASLAEEIKMHGFSGFPYRIYSVQIEGYGYGSPLFYGDLFLYIPAVFVALGANPAVVLKIILILIYPLAGVTAYLFAYKSGFNKESSWLFAVIYMISPYLTSVIILRQALGEALAIAILPLIALSINYVMNHREKRVRNIIFLAISMWLLINVHSISTVLVVVFLSIYVIYKWIESKNWKYIFDTFIDCIVAAIIFLIISASFLFPMLEQMSILELRGKSGSNITLAQENSFYFFEWFFDTRALGRLTETLFNLNILNFFTPTNKVGGGVYLPLIYIIIALIYLKFKEKEKINKTMYFFISLSVIICLFTTVQPLMDLIVNVFPEIQFPFRLIPFAFLFATITILCCKNIHIKEKVLFYCAIATLLLSVPVLTETITDNSTSNIDVSASRMDHLGMIDYLQESSVFHDGKKFYLYTDGYIYNYERKNGITEVYINKEVEKGEEIYFPLFYYKGYVAELPNGEIVVGENGIRGHVKITVPKTDYIDKTKVYYAGTEVQHISFLVSCVGWVSIIAFFIFYESKKSSCKKGIN